MSFEKTQKGACPKDDWTSAICGFGQRTMM